MKKISLAVACLISTSYPLNLEKHDLTQKEKDDPFASFIAAGNKRKVVIDNTKWETLNCATSCCPCVSCCSCPCGEPAPVTKEEKEEAKKEKAETKKKNEEVAKKAEEEIAKSVEKVEKVIKEKE